VRDQFLAVFEPIGVDAIVRLFGNLGFTEYRAELGKLVVVAGRDDDVTIGNWKNLIGDNVGMRAGRWGPGRNRVVEPRLRGRRPGPSTALCPQAAGRCAHARRGQRGCPTNRSVKIIAAGTRRLGSPSGAPV
jgi:hypothetical protein